VRAAGLTGATCQGRRLNAVDRVEATNPIRVLHEEDGLNTFSRVSTVLGCLRFLLGVVSPLPCAQG
jgi:hypothetical protein